MRLSGSGLEIIGAFLLAVEAIKLRNLRFIRERVLKVAVLKINPIITFFDAKLGEKTDDASFNSFLAFLVILGVCLSYMVLRFLGLSLSDTWGVFREFVPGPLWVDMLVSLPVVLVALLLANVVGASVYSFVVFMLESMIAILEFIERHTATGFIGIMGFLFFLSGAAVKAYLDWRGV